MKLDRFKLALAIVDIGGVIAFFVTLAMGSLNPAILIYLLVFNILVILTDTLRKGLVVHKPGEPVPDLPDMIPVNPVTGNLQSGPQTNIFGNIEQEEGKVPERVPEITPREAAPQRTATVQRPVLNVPSAPQDKDREEMEQVLKDWSS